MQINFQAFSLFVLIATSITVIVVTSPTVDNTRYSLQMIITYFGRTIQY